MRNLNIIPIIFVTLLLFGCMSTSKKNEINSFSETTMHCDDELNFSVEHPVGWARINKPDQYLLWPGNTQVWENGKQKNGIPDVEMKITSVPLFSFESKEAVTEEYLSAYPFFKIDKKEVVSFETGPALAITGRNQKLAHWVIIFSFQKSTFILDFSTDSNNFDDYFPIFEKIANSLREF